MRYIRILSLDYLKCESLVGPGGIELSRPARACFFGDSVESSESNWDIIMVRRRAYY